MHPDPLMVLQPSAVACMFVTPTHQHLHQRIPDLSHACAGNGNVVVAATIISSYPQYHYSGVHAN